MEISSIVNVVTPTPTTTATTTTTTTTNTATTKMASKFSYVAFHTSSNLMTQFVFFVIEILTLVHAK